MFDPAQVGSRMAPGDKVSMSFHKAKSEPGAPSFVSNAQAAGVIPGGGAPPVHMPQMSAVSHPAVPAAPGIDHRALLLAHLRRRMLGR